MSHETNGKRLHCPKKYVPIVSEYKKHFVIPLGGTRGSKYIFDLISTDFVVRGRLNGGKKKYLMHCAEFVKADCHHCEPNKPVHENYCVHYIHPTKGSRRGCLARGVIPFYR
tara:strand:- start:96 stop:431 length:336 start_codon:yes stop_codon:yes gene_type:complete